MRLSIWSFQDAFAFNAFGQGSVRAFVRTLMLMIVTMVAIICMPAGAVTW